MRTALRISVLSTVALLVVTCMWATELYGVDAPPLKDGIWLGDSVEYVSGRMFILFDDEADSAARQRVYDALGVYQVDTCGRCGFERLWIDTSSNVPIKCYAILDSAQVQLAEPAFLCQPMSLPDDPFFGAQWNLRNVGQNVYDTLYPEPEDPVYESISGADIRLPWALEVAAPADSILFGWIDSGVACDTVTRRFLPIDIDTTHLIRGELFYPVPGIETGVADWPINSHGTTTLSVAAAKRDNGLGIAGIIPDARFLIVKVDFGDGDQGLVADAFAYAAEHGVDIMNFSMGWRDGLPEDVVECEIELLLEQDGVLLCNVSSDQALDPDPKFAVPGVYASVGRRAGHLDGYRNVLAVGGSNQRDSVWEQSNHMWDPPDSLGYGESGEGICYVTALAPSTCVPVIDGDSTYLTLTGVSWAAPHAAALAGLIKAKLGDVPPESLRTVIEMTADKVWQDTGSVAYDPDWADSSWHPAYGSGRINAWRALTFNELWGTYDYDSGEATWSGDTVVASDLVINAGDSVTISAGATLRIRGIDHYANSDEVDTNRAEIIVKGTLIADASGGDPITFEAYDSVPGDSAAWYGIRVLDQGHVVFRNVIIKNAYCGLDLNSETPDEVYSCQFSNNKMYGIYCRNDSTASLETVIRKNTITKDSVASYTGYGIYTKESPQVDSNSVSFYNYGIWALGGCPTIVSNTIHCAYMGIHARSTDGATVWCNEFTGQFSRAIDYWHADVNTQANIICPDTTNGNDNCAYGLYFGPWGDGVVWFNRFFNCHSSGAAVVGSYPNFGDDEDIGYNWFRIPDTSAKALTSSVSISAERCLWQLGDSILDSASYIDPWVDGSVDFDPFLLTTPPPPVPFDPDNPPDQKRAVTQEQDVQLPLSWALEQNYPNPFNPATVISYALPEGCEVKLTIYNLLGQRVVELVNELQSPGYYRVTWDGKDESGGSCASGVYLYKIEAGDFTQSRKMMLLK